MTYSNPGTTAAYNVVLTDSLPSTVQMSYVTASASNGGVYNPSADTLTWTIPVIPPGTSVSVTYQIQASLEAANIQNNILFNQACLAYGMGKVCASNAVTVTGAYLVQVSVYNSAGELVKTIVTFELNNGIGDFTLQNGTITTDSQSAQLFYNGLPLASWDATDASGQKVSNGTYYIKVQSTDPTGITTTITKNVVVAITRSTLMIAVYNEAGEIVKEFSEQEIQNLLGGGASGGLMPADFNVASVSLSSSTLVVSSGGGNGPMTITLGSGRSITWNGTGTNGQYLTSGTYFLEVESTTPGQTDQQIILPVRIKNNGANNVSGVVLAPNPVYLNKTTQAKFLVNTTNSQVTSVEVRLYTVAGELMKTLYNVPGNTGEVDWDLSQSPIASGFYLAVAELHSNSGVLGHQVIKVEVFH